MIRRLVLITMLAGGTSVAVSGATPAQPLPSPESLEFFEKHIRPVLADSCYKCHSAEAGEKIKGGLRLDSREGVLKGGDSGKPAVVPGDPDASLLIQAIRHAHPNLQMPPKKKLAKRQIEAFVSWVKMGAPDPRVAVTAQPPRPDPRSFWAFQPPRDPPVPAVKDAAWPKMPIDHFILAKLEEKGLKPSSEADKRTLIRRATYDLVGLPPTPEEVDAFVADASPDAYEKLIDRLLTSPRYGERWGRYWLDLARYSDTKGYVYSDREETHFVHAFAYRDWVIKALNEDMPYDRFLLLQIAADQLQPPNSADNAHLAAMGFLTIGRRFLGIPHDIIDDRIDVVTRTTQGLTVACARCHEHKFDPIPIEDYYSLYGVFANSTERTSPLVSTPPRTKEYQDYQAELKKRTEKLHTTFKAKRDEMVERLRRKAPEYLVAVLDAEKLPNELFYENVDPDDINRVVVRQWQQYLFGRSRREFDPLFAVWHALAAVPEQQFDSRAQSVLKSLEGKLNPRVAEAFSKKPPQSMKDVAAVYGALVAEADKAWREATKANPQLAALPDAAQEEIRHVLYGPDSPATVPPGSIADIEWFFPEGTRVELGKLQKEIDNLNITHPGAPPHAVYLVDRETIVKPRVFKRGNPATKGDEVPIQYLSFIAGDARQPFTQGSGRLEMAKAIVSRDNPLAARVMANRVWAWHFGQGLVNTPSDFGTRCEPPSHLELLDYLALRFIENGWSLKKLHRLIMLSATYRQSSADNAAGSSIDPSNRLLWRFNRQRLDFEAMRDSLLAASGALDLTAGGRPVDLLRSTRRTVYGKVDRQFLPGVFRVFDFANPDLHIPQRAATTVPQQALFFMNSPFLAERARDLARRSETPASSPQQRVERMFRFCYQRPPTPQQTQAALRFIEQAAAAAPATAAPAQSAQSAWTYGYGEIDPATRRLKSFHKLTHFTGTAWQGGPEWPDTKLGWVQLTADGGHAGDDHRHAAVRRWTAPRDATVSISGAVHHAHEAGDGVVATLVSSRHGILATYHLHNRKADAGIGPLAVKKGDTLDFIVDRNNDLHSDDFTWSPLITAEGASPPDPAAPKSWDAKKEFAGPASNAPAPLTPWEQLAQVLLESNEFLFVD